MHIFKARTCDLIIFIVWLIQTPIKNNYIGWSPGIHFKGLHCITNKFPTCVGEKKQAF